MREYKNDKYIIFLLKYLIDNNCYNELINNIYICKYIKEFKYLPGLFGFDYLIHYDKYIKIGDTYVLLSTDNNEYVYDTYKTNDIIKRKIEDIEFKSLIYTSDEVLKTLLDLFEIDNDVVIEEKHFGKITMKSLMRGTYNGTIK